MCLHINMHFIYYIRSQYFHVSCCLSKNIINLVVRSKNIINLNLLNLSPIRVKLKPQPLHPPLAISKGSKEYARLSCYISETWRSILSHLLFAHCRDGNASRSIEYLRSYVSPRHNGTGNSQMTLTCQYRNYPGRASGMVHSDRVPDRTVRRVRVGRRCRCPNVQTSTWPRSDNRSGSDLKSSDTIISLRRCM